MSAGSLMIEGSVREDGERAPEPVIQAVLRGWRREGASHLISTSGCSMMPLIRDGDHLLVTHDPAGVRRGDVIVCRGANGLVAHRVLQITASAGQACYLTQGDNASQADPLWSADQFVGRVTAVERAGEVPGRCRQLHTSIWRIAGWLIAVLSLYGASAGRKVARLGLRVWLGVAAPARRPGPEPEDQVIRLSARQHLLDRHRDEVFALCRERAISWERVFAEADRHGIAPLVLFSLDSCVADGLDVPQTVMRRFRLAAYQNRKVKENEARTLLRLLDHFSDREIPVMLIKGLAADATVYGQPWYTASGDIDFVVKARPGTVTDAEITAAVGGRRECLIEWQPWEHHDVTINGALPVDFDRVWADAVKADYRGREVYLMSPEDRLITACISTCRRRFERLKQLCDLAEMLTVFDATGWEGMVAKASAYDCANIVYAALLMARLTLDCMVPDAVLSALPVGRVKRALIDGLCRRAARRPLKAWNAGPKIGRWVLTSSLILPYLTHRPYQLWRRVRWGLLAR